MNTEVDKLTDTELAQEVAKLTVKVKSLQSLRAHKTADGRKAISVMQSQLHRMNMEVKRRYHAALREKHNHAITPSAS